MIVAQSRNWWRMVVTRRGSTVGNIWRRLAVTTGLAVVVTVFWETFDLQRFSLTLTPFSLIGLALSIFLGFQNNAAYDRFWEARKLWGSLVNGSRSWARQVHAYVEAPPGGSPDEVAEVDALRVRLIQRQIAFVHALRLQLREGGNPADLDPYLDPGERDALSGESNRPSAITFRTGLALSGARRRGWLHPVHAVEMERSLALFTDIQGACERIKSTPVPFVYAVLTHRIVALYCLGLPFGIQPTVGVFTPLVVAMIAFAFYSLDSIGAELEEPFGLDPSDLPLAQISRMIEINLLQRAGAAELPSPLMPVRGVIL